MIGFGKVRDMTSADKWNLIVLLVGIALIIFVIFIILIFVLPTEKARKMLLFFESNPDENIKSVSKPTDILVEEIKAIKTTLEDGYTTCFYCGKQTKNTNAFGKQADNCDWCDKPIPKFEASNDVLFPKLYIEHPESTVKNEHGWNKIYDISGIIREKFYKKNGKIEGVRELFYNDGKTIHISANYDNGKLNGEYKEWSISANVWRVIDNYKNGKKHGICTLYFTGFSNRGEIAGQTHYKNGKEIK